MHNIEIPSASIAQVKRGNVPGGFVHIEDDVCGIAKTLEEIDPSLRLHFNSVAEYYVVRQVLPDGSEELVTTTTELDHRLCERVRRIVSPSYDFAGELDRMDEEAAQRASEEFSERVHEVGEKLAHAIRQDVHGKLPGGGKTIYVGDKK